MPCSLAAWLLRVQNLRFLRSLIFKFLNGQKRQSASVRLCEVCMERAQAGRGDERVLQKN